MTEQEDREHRRLIVQCRVCEGRGATVHPTATVSGETSAVLRKCEPCRGTGRRRGFHPPV